MVKLIRLISDEDGVFQSSFGSDMTIKENAKIALLNLTFKTSKANLVIDSTNNALVVMTDIDVQETISQGALKPKTYTDINIDELAGDLTFALNGALTIPAPSEANTNGISSMFEVYLYDEKYLIAYRYCPFVNPLVNATEAGNDNYPSRVFCFGAGAVIQHTHTASPTLTTITNYTGRAANTNNVARYQCIEGYTFSKGSGLVTLRIADSVDNGSGLLDNGATLGITDRNLMAEQFTDDVPMDAMIVNIRYSRPTENYFYSVNGAAYVDSGIAPEQVEIAYAELNIHDVMYIQKNGPNWDFGVFQMVGEEWMDLSTGNIWTQAPVAATENFDETNLGDLAKYRRVQVGSPAFEQWWVPVSETEWEIYNTKPVIGDTPDATAIIDLGTGVITVGGGTTTFTPAQLPTVLGSTVATNQKFGTLEVADGKTYRPWMSVQGAEADIKLDSFNFSINPWTTELPGIEGPNDDWQQTNRLGESGNDNGYNAIRDGDLGDVMTNIYNTSIAGYGRWDQDITIDISMFNQLWETLGFTQKKIDNGPASKFFSLDTNIGLTPSGGLEFPFWGAIPAESVSAFLLSDNFMVISDTIKLDSFDASDFEYGVFSPNSQVRGDKAGRRKNILMTIPVNDNASGIVEFQTNTPIFININNALAQNLKNLNFRILKKDFHQVVLEQGDSAVMTLLIED